MKVWISVVNKVIQAKNHFFNQIADFLAGRMDVVLVKNIIAAQLVICIGDQFQDPVIQFQDILELPEQGEKRPAFRLFPFNFREYMQQEVFHRSFR